MAPTYRRTQLMIALAAVGVTIGVLFAGRAIDHYGSDNANRHLLNSELTSLANRLQNEIDSSVDLIRGLATIISARNGISEAEFTETCKQLMADEPKIRNIALVKGSIITFNCPLPQNAATIGADLRKRPDQWASFERMQQTGAPDIAGPVALVQGGWGIIARVPIFVRDGTTVPAYWGAISMPLAMDGLFLQSGLPTANEHYDIAIRGYREATTNQEVLFGKASVFDEDPVVVDIPFPDGTWHLAAHLPTHDHPFWTDPTDHVSVFVIALLSGLLFFVLASYAARRRREESESNRNRDLLRAFMENAPIAMYVKDLSGGYIDLNAEARNAFRVGDRPYLGAKAHEFFSDTLAERLADEDERAKAGEVVRAERHTGELQAYPWEREIKFPVTDTDGKVIAIGGYVFDITAAKEAEARMVSALHTAERANRAKSEFLATMSHELRTPLNAIIGFSDVIKQELYGPIGNPVYQDYAKDIHASGQQLLDLLGGIIDLSAVESGHVEVRHEPVTTAEMLGDCKPIVEALAQERHHLLDVEDHAHQACWADRRLLRQVLLNLASNATKYTRKGGHIEISTHDQDDMVVFRIRDNGVGMSPSEIERAIQPFTRLGDPMRADVGGSGIGLALVKRLVEAMRGRLTIQSEPNIGTIVDVGMPKAVVPAVTAA